ncbi:3-alpha-hydroxysteroid dehydrogenase [Actinophytocola xinjiangensis]|uniref:3-alpha-hydroxysteroid dehydrogenase n=1 Tax=Actinophytocola xinjiangensis TaxID=485602 RepID=A0A7Z0WHQ2_9PSEU|nr:SDR family oxidoreductase [Actinophytocola xinjiangensis]OLF06464.1 3-alpha-hydroxysteroid dehydrogenase [Actinophytocola xinjiangensis]
MGRLAGKVALVTGASGGQGAAAARRFAAEGATVVLADVVDEPGRALADELGAHYRHLDVSAEAGWAEVVAGIAGEHGPVTVLVNNAGVLHLAPLAETTLADYQRVIGVNQTGVFLGMRAVAPGMVAAGGGSIINVSSVEGLGAGQLLTAYTASKFAVRGMTKVAALELAGAGVRVNSVHPGVVATPLLPTALGGVDVDLSFVAKRVPLRRVAQPAEIAELVLFLASDESSYCTGAEFVADGGVTAGHALSSFG